MRNRRRFTTPDRLSDVIALIQLLALAAHTWRSEQGITEQLKGRPQSAKTWLSIGEQHGEFFRVGNEGVSTPQLSLIARIVQESLPRETGEYKRDKLSNAELGNLLKLAVQLYDKEAQRSEFWQPGYQH